MCGPTKTIIFITFVLKLRLKLVAIINNGYAFILQRTLKGPLRLKTRVYGM